MKITDVAARNTIDLDVEASTKEEAIRAVAAILNKAGKLDDADAYIQAVLDREHECTTGIGGHLAIPHGRSRGVRVPAVAVCRFREPVEWDSLDGQPVLAACMLAIPESGDGSEHLKMLSALAVRLMDEEVAQALLQEKDPERILALFDKEEEENEEL